MNVAIYQPVIPEYRIPLFTALQQRPEINIVVFASMSAPGSPDTPRDDFVFPFNSVKFHAFMSNNVLSWQSGLRIPDHFHSGDVVVICGNPRYLSNYPLILNAKHRHIGVVWWGHGHTPGPKRLSEDIRKKIMKVADVILLYNDKEVENYRRAGFAPDRLFATNNSIDVSEIEHAKKSWHEVRLTSFKDQHGLKDSKIMLYCGRLAQKCGLSVALEALSILLKQDPSYRLVIIGDGPEKDKLITYAKELNVNDHVYWCRAIYDQREIAPWFLSADTFVYPGAIGLSLMHAFSYGLPVVTHSVAGEHNPEFNALQDGYNGMLFNKGDSADLAKKIEYLAINSKIRRRMGENAFSTIQKDYSFDGMVKRFVNAICFASEVAKAKNFHGFFLL